VLIQYARASAAEWTIEFGGGRICRMGRYKFIAYARSTTSRYIVVWSLQWQVIDCQKVAPHRDLSAAMTETLRRLEAQGWEAEGDTPYGFAFIRRQGERRLLMLTARDPFDSSLQSFDPFKNNAAR
jgi:hypothetical protein